MAADKSVAIVPYFLWVIKYRLFYAFILPKNVNKHTVQNTDLHHVDVSQIFVMLQLKLTE